MKYRDLELSFSIEDVQFNTLSICLEKLNKPMPMHSHSKNSYEIHYVSYGCGRLISGGRTYEITPGTLFVTGPEVEHEQISLPDNPMTEYCIYVKVNTSGRPSQNKGSLVNTFLKQPFWFGMGDNSYHELMKQIFAELETRNSGYELVLQALLQQVILHLIRKYKADTDLITRRGTSAPTANFNDLTYLIIEEAFLYDYRDITLDELAKRVGLGKRQTERLLQLHYNKTFLQKKTEARMSAASSLLRDTDQSISSIALSLGYSSVEHFSNAFKRYSGHTASEFRKMLFGLYKDDNTKM